MKKEKEKCLEDKLCVGCRFYSLNEAGAKECGAVTDRWIKRSIKMQSFCPFKEEAHKELKTTHRCSDKTCGDCDYYKYYSMCGRGCHLTPETGVIRQGPITKKCPYKVKISKEEQQRRNVLYKKLSKFV